MLLLIPVLSANYGYKEVIAIVTRWKNIEQERAANLKLGELSVQIEISQHISAFGSAFRDILHDLQTEYPDKLPLGLQFSGIASSVFRPPFPEYDLLVFSRHSSDDRSELIFSNRSLSSRRSSEMVFDHLLAENLNQNRNDNDARRSEKILRRVFGRATLGRVLANSQRGLSTPVIYGQMPSFLVWDYVTSEKGGVLGFFSVSSPQSGS